MGETDECDICGSAGASYLIEVEGARMRVCRECSSNGKLLAIEREPEKPPKAAGRGQARAPVHAEDELVTDFAERIVKARKAMQIGIEVLAERISEKESFLVRIESGHATPDEKLARKLERELGIRLFEQVAESAVGATGKDSGKGITLGDIVSVRKRGKDGR
ncbi:MAG: multiprotein bridging factor aMBF1 [Candidatus Micrarchaeota archaeon]|nr:multiprotein bridging factor aMBF1 [Candidatus Micrarchaeota archaeon]